MADGDGTGTNDGTGASGSGTGAGDTGTGGAGAGATQDADGFPKGTPLAEMTPEQQAAYWKFQARKHETRNNDWQKLAGDKNADQLKADLDELAEIRKSKMTPSEQELARVREEAKAEARAEFAPKLAGLAFETALAHVPEKDRKELIEDLNLSKFVTDDGGVDMDAVAKTAARIAPATGTRTPVDFGAGRRTSTKTSAADQGREEAARRFGNKKDKQNA